MFLFIALSFALVYTQQCNSEGTACSTTISTCGSNLALNLNFDNFTSDCNCLNTALAASSCQRCFSVSLNTYIACVQLATLSRLLGSSAQPYDFKTCTACSNPPGDQFFPAACTRAVLKFIDGVVPYNTNTVFALDIPGICDRLGQFYDDFASCGFPGVTRDIINQYVCNDTSITDANYRQAVGICECGTHSVSRLGRRVIEILKTLYVSLATYLSNKGNLGVVTVDVLRNYTCDDRLVLNFAGTFDATAIRNAYAAFLGIPTNRIRVGVNIQDSMVNGKCVNVVEVSVSGKRFEQVGTATVQITNSVGSVVISTLLVVLISVLYLF